MERPHPDQKLGNKTFAQHGEDLMLLNLIRLMDLKRPSWLDLGAHHPVNISNTALLYERGFTGVNVEANPNMISEFLTLRPKDVNVSFGVGLETGMREFFMYSGTSGRNTFCAHEVRSMESEMRVKQTLMVPVMTLAQIVDKFCNNIYPDILLTDLEGMDYDILVSADFKRTRPKIIITETRRKDGIAVKSLMMGRQYSCYCRLGENLVFIHHDYLSEVY